ncbi:MAG: GNAT family N-acetyltransferase [Methylobacter sp.]
MENHLIILELSSSAADIAILRKFYTGLYESEFPDPDERESLENMERYLELKARGWYGKNNYHILVGMWGETPVAGSVTDYLAEANAGVIEFLLVASGFRGRGIASYLREVTEAMLKADALTHLARDLDLIVGEMNDPYKSGNVQDNLDPFVRARIWHNWGYQKLNFPYIQPALSDEQIPVRHLLLMGKILNADYTRKLPANLIKLVIHEYLRWAMRIEYPNECAEYREMSRYLDSVDTIDVIPLGNYVGYDDTKPMSIEAITSIDHPDLDAVLNVYRNSFAEGLVTATANDFKTAVSCSGKEEFHYHLWALRFSSENSVEGMSSFFTFPDAGFGGYLTLTGSLHGTGRLRLLLARMEEQMIKDSKSAQGWYLECEPQGPYLIFRQLGFREVAITYRQPPLEGNFPYGLDDSPVLRLMYKDFGISYDKPVLSCDEFLTDIEWIYRVVYHIKQPQQSVFFQDIEKQVSDCQDGLISFIL